MTSSPPIVEFKGSAFGHTIYPPCFTVTAVILKIMVAQAPGDKNKTAWSING